MTDPIDFSRLPAIASDRLGPCAGCGQSLSITFWMVRPIRCALDAEGVQQRAGLNTMLGSPALADVFAGAPAAREFDPLPEICVCETCACTAPLAALSLKE